MSSFRDLEWSTVVDGPDSPLNPKITQPNGDFHSRKLSNCVVSPRISGVCIPISTSTAPYPLQCLPENRFHPLDYPLTCLRNTGNLWNTNSGNSVLFLVSRINHQFICNPGPSVPLWIIRKQMIQQAIN